MTRIHVALLAGGLMAPLSVLTAAQQASAPGPGSISSRTTVAVTYEVRRTTQVDLTGTPLKPWSSEPRRKSAAAFCGGLSKIHFSMRTKSSIAR